METVRCPQCGRPAELVKHETSAIYHNVPVSYTEQYYTCRHCNESWYMPGQIDMNKSKAMTAYFAIVNQ